MKGNKLRKFIASIAAALVLTLGFSAAPVSAATHDVTFYQGASGSGFSCNAFYNSDTNMQNGLEGGIPSGSCNVSWSNNVSSLRITQTDRCLVLYDGLNWTGTAHVFMGNYSNTLINLSGSLAFMNNKASSYFFGWKDGIYCDAPNIVH